MKYAQLIIGLFAGTALGGVVVASTGQNTIIRTDRASSASAIDAEAVKKLVRETISEEPKLILDSVQKFQMEQQKKKMESAGDALKDPALREQVFNSKNAGTVGPADSKRVLVEFFDYNCPACKQQFKELDALVKKDKTLRIIFHEYPIFGPQSETNSKIAIAVVRLAPEKYFAFHEKMMGAQGRTDEKAALAFVKELGMDVAKVKTEMAKDEVAKAIEENHALGEKLNIQGTPTLVIGDELIPHAVMGEELQEKVNALK